MTRSRQLAPVLALAMTAAAALPSSAAAANLTLIGGWGSPGAAPGQFNLMTAPVAPPDGTVYTLENGNDRVQHFDPNGVRLGGWGSSGSGPGQFSQPEGVTVAASGEVSVVDVFLNKVERY